MKKRILSFFLALVMLFSCMSLNIFATEETGAVVAENTEATPGSVLDQSIKDHTADNQLESIVKRLTTVSGKYQVNFGTGGISNNESTRATVVNGRIVLGARSNEKATANQSFVQFNNVSNAGNRSIVNVYNGHYATGRSFVIQVGVEITDDFVKDTKGHFGLIQPTTYLTNAGRDNSGNNQVGTWMSHIVKIGSNATEAGNGTQASLQYLSAGSYKHLMDIEPGKTYNIAVSVNPQDVNAAIGIYGSYDIFVNGKLVYERAGLLNASQNASMAALSNAEKPMAIFVDGSYSDTYNTFAVGADLTAYFFLPVDTVLDDKTDTDADGIPDLYENVKGITAESAKSIKGYKCIGTVDGVQDFTLGFIRIAQTDGVTANWGSNDYMYLDNIFAFFADEYFDPISYHNFEAQEHTHDYTLETVDVKYVCEYCNSYKIVTEAIDANGDRVCDVCVGGLEEGGILSIDELNGMLASDDIRYTNDFGTGGSHGFHLFHNTGEGLSIPAENGNGYLLYGPTTGDEIRLYGQFHVSGGDYNQMRAWPLNNFNTYRGKSYVISTDIMRYEGCETGSGNLFNLMNYAKLNAAGDGFEFAGAFSPLSIDKNGTIYYNDANGASYNSGFTLEAGRYYNVAVHHTPKTNSYDIFVDGVKINEKSISALGSSMNSALTFDASEKLGIVSNGAVDFIPCAVQLAQINAKLTQNAWALDNIKFYYSEDFIECAHEYELTHEHDIANNANTVSYVCTACGLSKTVTLGMHDVETTAPAYTDIVNNDLTVFGTTINAGRTEKNGVVICNGQGGLSFINDGERVYAKFGNRTFTTPTDSDYLQIMYKANWDTVQSLINSDSKLIGAPYVASIDFMHYGARTTYPFGQVSSYIHNSNSTKVVNFVPVFVTASGELKYNDAGVAKDTTVRIEPGKNYTISYLHTPATNTFDVYVDGVRVVKGAKALNENSIKACTWTNANGKKISEKSFIPGYIRTGTINDNEKGGDIFAVSNLRLYTASVNAECCHSFVANTCEWCGAKDANYARCDICDGTAISEGAAVVSKSASLGEMIDMNVYMALSEKLVKTEGAKVTLNCGNRSAEYALADAVKEANGLYKFSIELRSTQMASDVEVKVVGETSDTYKTSIKAYAEELIEANVSEKATALAKAMLNYGATAQKYFAIKNDDAALDDVLANAGLSADDQKVDAEIMNKAGLNALTYAPNDSDPLDGVQFTAATIMFSAKTHVKVYFTASENATVTVGGRQVTPIASENEGEYYVTFTVENPAEAMTRVSIVVNDGAASVGQDFSAGLLVKVGVDANANAELTALLLAYANYAYCASNYAI